MPIRKVTTPMAMRQVAETWTAADLLRFWERIKNGKRIPGWQKGGAFEYLIIRAFQLEGTRVCWPFQVTYPQKFGTMEQIDGIVYLGERAFLLESKDLSEPAAIEAVAKLRFRLEGRPPSMMGVLFSVQDFTLPTEVFTQFVSPLNVLLWGRADLDVAIKSSTMTDGLKRKLEHANEHGLPLFALE